MKATKYILVLLFVVGLLTHMFLVSYADQYVRGYYKKDGTYVQGHYRSNRDGNPYNNYSYPGNYNPYTGKTATGDTSTYLKKYYLDRY